MRSTPLDDATAQARIRDAAIRLIGRLGYTATTVRAIADEAGVSAALVIHHFGSKDGLREACDGWILDQVESQSSAIGEGGASTTAAMRDWFSTIDLKLPWIDYLARQFTDPSDIGDRIFDRFVEYTESMFATGVADGSVRASEDEHMRAVILTGYGLSTLVFGRHIARSVDQPSFNAETARRMVIPALELFTHGVYTSDALLASAADAVASEKGTPQ